MALNNRDLAYMRDVVRELMPDRCHILSRSAVSNGQGGQTVTWETASADVPCRLDVVSNMLSGEQVSGGALQAFKSTMLSLPHDTTITEAMRVLHNSVTYAVKHVNTNQSWIAVKRVELERV